jgi:hypothetical protein
VSSGLLKISNSKFKFKKISNLSGGITFNDGTNEVLSNEQNYCEDDDDYSDVELNFHNDNSNRENLNESGSSSTIVDGVAANIINLDNSTNIGNSEFLNSNISTGTTSKRVTKKNSKFRSRAKKSSSLFINKNDQCNHAKKSSNLSNSSTIAKLIHSRICHRSNKHVFDAIRKGLVNSSVNLSDFSVNSGFCECCALSKGKRDNIKKKTNFNPTKKFEFVVSDIQGPFRVESLGGARYLMSIIDVLTRYSWLFFFKNKSEAFDFFKLWIESELSNDDSIHIFRTDNGGEYKSNEFNIYLKKLGIKINIHQHILLNSKELLNDSTGLFLLWRERL